MCGSITDLQLPAALGLLFRGFEKKIGLGKAEAIDGLFHIAHDEKVAGAFASRAGGTQVPPREQRRLQRVDVLELIDQQIVKKRWRSSGEWPGARALQQIKGEASSGDRGEVQAILLAFGPDKCVGKITGKGDESIKVWGQRLQVAHAFYGGGGCLGNLAEGRRRFF